ncbi:hypothetical protein [uncultured Mediterranean phage uvMED]|nr:hypothetical protein [uncultured Mediterranean phage uvMED]BAQ91481.1 hypothetical protein [uncultured Mediterranean phage uvMED]BAQ91514.1 hypothetical protein [uncultured Mediterranean phage uvMED]
MLQDIEKQKRFFHKVKTVNVQFYKLFKKCEKDNTIYKAELKRIKGFYDSFKDGAFHFNTDINGCFTSDEIPLLEKYENKTWKNISEKIYKRLKSWDKSNIKSGKRPKEDTLEYQEKLYKEAQLQDKAKCGICNKYWEQVDMNGRENILADHGFTLQWGGRNGVCFGARYLGWERSPESKIAYVEKVLNVILKNLSKQKPTVVDLDKAIQQANKYNKLVDQYLEISTDIKNELSHLKSMYRRKSMLAYGKSARLFVECDEHITSLEKLIEVKATPEVKKAYELEQKIIKPSIKFSGMQNKVILPTNKDDISLELLTRIWSNYKDRIEADKLEFQTAIENWKPKLTPREKMNKQKERKI